MGVFLKDPNPYLREFWKKNDDYIQTPRSTSSTEDWTWQLSLVTFMSRTTQPLVWPFRQENIGKYEYLKETATSLFFFGFLFFLPIFCLFVFLTIIYFFPFFLLFIFYCFNLYFCVPLLLFFTLLSIFLMCFY